MRDHSGLSRRQVLGMAIAAGGLTRIRCGRFGVRPGAEADARGDPRALLPRTEIRREDRRLDGPAGQARRPREVIYVMGRVVNVQGHPLSGARVELWQANTHGRYTHPSDTHPAPLDPNFEGFAVQDTDAEGRYRFKTIKPGAYPATANWMRPPHLHFEVTGKINRTITQMYFPGEPLNDKDLLLQNIRANKEGVVAKVLPPTSDLEPDSRIVVWDIVLDKGEHPRPPLFRVSRDEPVRE